MKKIVLAMAAIAMTICVSCGKSESAAAGTDSTAVASEQPEAAIENIDVIPLLEKGKAKELTPAECLAIAKTLTEWTQEGMAALKAAPDDAAKLKSVEEIAAAHPYIKKASDMLSEVTGYKPTKEAVNLTPEQEATVTAAWKGYNEYYDAAYLANASEPLFKLK